ncbi:MAG: hypothetical protein OXU98_10260, partial [Gammaproteobacteria bacterium]|nr:hypothetical protein [Gammaproteobacteria bacterium]
MNRSPNSNSTPKNIPLSQDEWILCLEVYLRHRGQPLPKENSREIHELSESMRRIHEALAGEPAEHFRPPYGVLRRVLEFQHLDRDPECADKKPKRARDVWDTWGEKPHATIAQIAEAIKKCVAAEEVQSVGETDIEYNHSVVESRILTRVHTFRERDKRIVRLKKEKFQDENKGRLFCEACDFDFANRYPRHGDGYIECHHIKPLSE